MVFVQRAHLPGIAYVRLLHGDFIGCLMKDGISIPHLINWRTKDAHPLADLPDVKVSLAHSRIKRRHLQICREQPSP